eukprot:CAMPEP_0114126116 /NCGR_PEP_ID=MMETSP0043_2-20121206/9657_1 /TAXON_ID=464988 /ORGANISM="Hemiselmis andersenii, Strain CCMP644" /LENGTH=70 /DNA_ID=CAMNT_0001219077 /DNA_START=312 /DNA_END=527 /DNA_ORIENTATION=+
MSRADPLAEIDSKQPNARAAANRAREADEACPNATTTPKALRGLPKQNGDISSDSSSVRMLRGEERKMRL